MFKEAGFRESKLVLGCLGSVYFEVDKSANRCSFGGEANISQEEDPYSVYNCFDRHGSEWEVAVDW